jgi:hypothetical protein
MSDKNEKNTTLVVLQEIPSHQYLVKANRWLLFTVFFLMSVIVVGGFFLFPHEDVTAFQKAAITSNATQTNPVLSAEVNALKGQFVGLVSGSIESKLRTLEESVRLGTAPDSLLTIEELRNDIQALRAYSNASGNDKAAGVANDQIVQEMSQLKGLVYLSLASCGVMILAVAGIWIRSRRQLPYKEKVIRHLGKE